MDAPANRKKGFYTNRDPNKKFDSFLYEAAQNLKSYQILKTEIKKLKNF
jgi:hypothetical protein